MGIGLSLPAEVARVWAAAALLLLLAAGLWQFFALRTRVGSARAAALAALRTGALALVLVLLAGPRRVIRSVQPESRPVSVLVDSSLSMGLRGGLEQSRLERVRTFLASEGFRNLGDEFTPSYDAFSTSLTRVGGDALATLRADGARTDLEGALREADTRGGSAAIIVFTDGGHGAPGRAAGGDAPLATPVVLVGVGAGERTRDVEIAAAEPPAVAFAGSPATIAVSLRATGFGGREVPLLLKRGEQVLVSRTLRLPADGETLRETLEWAPPAPGIHALTLQVPPLDGEQIADNNRVELALEAVRDRIRVLVVSGTPSWSYRFLRGALKGDPSLDVVSFIILRSASDAVDVPQQDLSLIPFPTQKIFLEELPNFDLLIFDNFAYQPYLPPAYLDKIEEFVRGGGGFWMLGGPFSYLGGRYQGTPIARLLPVSLPDPPPAGGGFRDVGVRPRLTAAGRAHPFFQGLAEQGGEPPPLQGYNVTGPALPGAVLLAEVPAEGGPAQPLVVLGRYGKGRVLAVLTDSLWGWAFEEAGRGRGSRPYLAFVRQAVRWSIGDPELEPARVEPERARIAPGESVRARIRILGEDFLPAARPELSVTVRGPGGETRAVAAVPEAPGTFLVEAPAPGEGTWEIVAEASARGKVYARASAVVTAAWPLEEYRSPGLNREALTALLAGRRGALLELAGDEDTAEALRRVLRELTGDRGERDREEGRALAETVPVFLLFLALLAAEWTLRRRSGLD
jgi:uncharacterized membrane protein